MALNFRQLVRTSVPSWQYEGEGAALLHSLAMLIDAATQRALSGLYARFPSRAGASALRAAGDERGILRGREETDAHYATRLQGWRGPRGHRIRGGAWGLLEQIAEFFGGVAGHTIDARGNRYDRGTGGAETQSEGNAWNWDGEPSTPRWARFWVVRVRPGDMAAQLDFGSPTLWGGALGTPGYSIGQQGVSADDVAKLRALMRPPRPWRMCGSVGEWIVAAFSSASASSLTPDGTWKNWSKMSGTTQVAARDTAYRYWSLAPDLNNSYAGNRNNFCTQYPGAAGSLITGNRDAFPSSLTLPNGRPYAGNRDRFPAKIPLVDDGSQP